MYSYLLPTRQTLALVISIKNRKYEDFFCVYMLKLEYFVWARQACATREATYAGSAMGWHSVITALSKPIYNLIGEWQKTMRSIFFLNGTTT